ncbi:Acetylcholinesterase-like protein, partial [Dinothrombium tinctorium]
YCLVLVNGLSYYEEASDPLIVKTSKGLVRGITLTAATGKQVDTFLGIPYAKPPVREYRFRHPKPIDRWEGVFNATKLPNSCVQTLDEFFGDFRGSTMWNANTKLDEDCLKLNIWVPKPRPKDAAVLLWIYGGGFATGTSTLEIYDGKILAQAILQSGGPTCPWAMVDREEAKMRGLRLAEAAGCPHDPENLDATMECLRKKDAKELVEKEVFNGVVDFMFVPIMDGAFFDETPQQSLLTKNFKKTKIMTGCNLEEGFYFLVYYLPSLLNASTEDVYVSREDFVRTIRDINPYVSKIGQDAIIFEYTDWVNVEDKIKNRDAIDKAVGDFAFSCHAIEIAYRYALSGQDVYSYYFTHRSSVSPWPQWMGVLHADEINFIFGEPLDPRFGYNAAEIELSKRMMRYWANFAKT